MTAIRSLLFVAWLYLTMVLYAVIGSPSLLMSHRQAMAVAQGWGRAVIWGARHIAGIKLDVRGDDHRPQGAALVAAKHQGMLDVIVLLAILPDPCFVLKKELVHLPFFGWYVVKTGMIAVDRAGHAAALKAMAAQARDRLAAGRQIVIFPEGTRTDPGQPGDYKPGVAAIYRDLQGPCWPVATNSGLFWPAHGVMRRPGLAVFEFLEPIPAQMKRGPFMTLLESRIEVASTALLEPNGSPAHLQ